MSRKYKLKDVWKKINKGIIKFYLVTGYGLKEIVGVNKNDRTPRRSW